MGVGPDVDPDDFESFWSTRPDAGTVRLVDGQDFDLVVLGIAVGALPYLLKRARVRRCPGVSRSTT